MSECKYNFDVPCSTIYLGHILMGLLFSYIGYLLIEGKKVDKWLAISLVTIGVLAILYHSHLWYVKSQKKN